MLLLLALLAATPAHAAEKLVLVGGGEHPALATSRFCEWGGGHAARVLVITWATAYPEEAFKDFATEIAPCGAQSVDTAANAQDLLARLPSATAVFFTGGDQNRIMDHLLDSQATQALRERYHQGIVFGGTSAGTAIMSPLMITGEGDWTVIDGASVGTRPGLGLLDGTILDTHFIRRQRENRLFSLVLAHPDLLGVGIDEDTALLVNEGQGEVTGRGEVMLVSASAQSRLEIQVLHAGQRVGLERQK